MENLIYKSYTYGGLKWESATGTRTQEKKEILITQ